MKLPYRSIAATVSLRFACPGGGALAAAIHAGGGRSRRAAP